MPQYKFKARDENGSMVENVIAADNTDLAKVMLQDKGLWVIDIKSSSIEPKNLLNINLDDYLSVLMGVSLKDLVIFCRQFASLVNAGVAMMRALNIMAEQTQNPAFSKILKEIKDEVEQGISLSEAFGKYPKVFDTLFISMVRAGETGGVLDEVLNRIAKFMEDKARLSAKVKSAMAYPMVVTVLAIIIFFVMLTVILPKFSEIFSRLGGAIPAYTQFLINISEVLRSAWLLLIIACVGIIIFGFKKIYSTRQGKYIIDKIMLKLPVLGGLMQKVAVARFSRTFGTLIRSGVPILSSLEIVEESSGNAVFAKAISNVHEEIKQGGSINAPLEKSKIFPPMVVSMIAVGEETGELDSMLSKIADFYDSEVDAAVDALTSLIEPLMMVFLGGMVGAVIVGMYLPMFKIFENIH